MINCKKRSRKEAVIEVCQKVCVLQYKHRDCGVRALHITISMTHMGRASNTNKNSSNS